VAIEKGKLVRWIDEKGFGFIKPENGSNEIFIHISALKSMSRKPIVGDVIQYQIGFDSNGKTRAVDAKIEGVSQVMTLAPLSEKRKERPHRTYSNRANKHQKSHNIFPIIVLISVIVFVYSKFSSEKKIVEEIKPPKVEIQPIKQIEQVQFQCQGKIRCTEMSTYEEAIFYLQNCPGTKMDGDYDGIPCEDQFGK
jgi:cold shock CspA family protein